MKEIDENKDIIPEKYPYGSRGPASVTKFYMIEDMLETLLVFISGLLLEEPLDGGTVLKTVFEMPK